VKHLQLYILAGILFAMSIGLFAYKSYVLNLPLRPYQLAENWEVQAKITFEGNGGPVRLALFTPENHGQFTIVDQRFASNGYGLATGSENDNRISIFSTSKADGPQTVYYRFLVYRHRTRVHADVASMPALPEIYLDEAQLVAAQGLLTATRGEAADDDTRVRLLLKRLFRGAEDANARALVSAGATTRERLMAVQQVLALGEIPARLVTGIALVKAKRNAGLVHWLEVYLDGRWRAFAPQTETYELPTNFLPWWRGRKEGLVSLRGGRNVERKLSVATATASALRAAIEASSWNEKSLLSFSLFALPVDTQQIYRIILTVPFGVIFLTIVRNMIGLRTFGTFMPVLVAIAFRETQLLWGLFLLGIVVAVALLVRVYLGTLRLLVVPRLSSILIVVILAMAGVSVLSNQLGFTRGLSVTLFPMVILTMTVERMSIVWDERGPVEMLRQGMGSILVAVVSYFIMTNPYVEHIAIVYPELLLALLACNLLVGRYSGFRLLDLVRFRVLGGRRA